ncbi:MAG TPA: hypothetical protein VKY22_01470 [Bradyrhizobium sp.]|nr:hypothetical protein [Bradyrhizobium sp.]
MQRPFVKHLLATAVLSLAIGGAAVAAELPTFEVSSFPATPVQVSVMGSAGVQEQSAQTSLTRGGMPASPAQLAVLTPRHGAVRAANETTVGAARN